MTRSAARVEDQWRIFGTFPSLAEAMGAEGLRDGEAVISAEQGRRRVVLFFSQEDFPGARFGYRCKPPGEDLYEEVWLAEELATGALHRTMRYDAPVADETGTIWLRLHGQLLGVDDSAALSRLRLRAFAHVEATEAGSTCGIYGPDGDRPRACGRAAVARATATAFDRGVVGDDGEPLRRWGHLYVGACTDHVEELQRRCAIRGGRVEPLR